MFFFVFQLFFSCFDEYYSILTGRRPDVSFSLFFFVIHFSTRTFFIKRLMNCPYRMVQSYALIIMIFMVKKKNGIIEKPYKVRSDQAGFFRKIFLVKKLQKI